MIVVKCEVLSHGRVLYTVKDLVGGAESFIALSYLEGGEFELSRLRGSDICWVSADRLENEVAKRVRELLADYLSALTFEGDLPTEGPLSKIYRRKP
jgi:hypothetical protein